MKTAVEWLEEQINLGFYEIGLIDAIQQAKEMEKEQMKKFYGKLQVDENNLIMDFENYYNQTFNQQEQ